MEPLPKPLLCHKCPLISILCKEWRSFKHHFFCAFYLTHEKLGLDLILRPSRSDNCGLDWEQLCSVHISCRVTSNVVIVRNLESDWFQQLEHISPGKWSLFSCKQSTLCGYFSTNMDRLEQANSVRTRAERILGKNNVSNFKIYLLVK